MIDAELMRLLLDGGFGLVALWLLHGVAGKLGAMEATLSVLVTRVLGEKDAD